MPDTDAWTAIRNSCLLMGQLTKLALKKATEQELTSFKLQEGGTVCRTDTGSAVKEGAIPLRKMDRCGCNLKVNLKTCRHDTSGPK